MNCRGNSRSHRVSSHAGPRRPEQPRGWRRRRRRQPAMLVLVLVLVLVLQGQQ